jgi:hypothetical protein
MDCDVEEFMSNVVLKKQMGYKNWNLESATTSCSSSYRWSKNCSEAIVTVNLPQLNDRTMISLGAMVTIMLIRQYNQ